MKNNICLKLSLIFILMFLGFSNGAAQKKVKKKYSAANLKDTVEFIAENIKAQVSFLDGKEKADCPNQNVKKIVYQEAIFAESNLRLKLTDETTRSVCSLNLKKEDKVTSTSIEYDDVQLSIPLRQINSSAIKSGSCQLELGYQRKEGSCFFVSLETFNNAKAFKIDKINSFKMDEKQGNDKKAISYSTDQYQLYFSDQETAESVAKAFAQAIKLSGGR